jgi:hypothetical protein
MPRWNRAQDAANRLPVMGQGAPALAVRYFRRVRVYGERLRCLHRAGTEGRGDSGRRPGERRRPAGSGASCRASASARPGRVSMVRSPAPGGPSRRRSGLPGLCRGVIGLPGRRVRVPRGCRARAAGIDLLPRGACGALPAWVRVPARRLARRAEDGYQPRSQQDEDNHGHDEHRGKRHERTRVRQEIPLLRRQAAGCCSRSPPGTGHRGRS